MNVRDASTRQSPVSPAPGSFPRRDFDRHVDRAKDEIPVLPVLGDEGTAAAAAADSAPLDGEAMVSNPRLAAAIQRVLDRAGNGFAENARYDRQYHRHNKSR